MPVTDGSDKAVVTTFDKGAQRRARRRDGSTAGPHRRAALSAGRGCRGYLGLRRTSHTTRRRQWTRRRTTSASRAPTGAVGAPPARWRSPRPLRRGVRDGTCARPPAATRSARRRGARGREGGGAAPPAPPTSVSAAAQAGRAAAYGRRAREAPAGRTRGLLRRRGHRGPCRS